MTAVGVIDIRNIVAVRRASQPVMRNVDDDIIHASQGPGDWEDLTEFWELERSAQDDEDEGGDLGLARSSDRSGLRMRRSFELIILSGGIIRYEVSSLFSNSSSAILTFGYHRHSHVVSLSNGLSDYDP